MIDIGYDYPSQGGPSDSQDDRDVCIMANYGKLSEGNSKFPNFTGISGLSLNTQFLKFEKSSSFTSLNVLVY